MKITGILVLILGLILNLFMAFNFFFKEKIIDIGTNQITREQPHSSNGTPFLGLTVMTIGGFIILQAKKKN